MSTSEQHENPNRTNQVNASNLEEDSTLPILTGPRISSMVATISCVFGVCSLGLVPMVFPAFVSAGLAVVFGHLAVWRIRHSADPLLGIGKARLGLLTGYASLIGAFVLWPFLGEARLLLRGFFQSEGTARAVAVGDFNPGELGRIEKLLVLQEEGDFGNNEDAQALADQFRLTLKGYLEATLETESTNRTGRYDSDAVDCYCHAGDGICFIARVVGLDNFTEGALATVKKSAWRTAQQVLRQSKRFPQPVQLAVAIVDDAGCEWVMTGWSVENNVPFSQPLESDATPSLLAPFFVAESSESEQ